MSIHLYAKLAGRDVT